MTDTTTKTVTIGGEERRIAPFSAFKALFAMGEVSALQGVWRQVLHAGAEFKREWEATHFVEFDRAEARHRYPPRPLPEDVPVIDSEGAIVTHEGMPVLRQVPMIRDGETIYGRDPLGHLTEEDWAASGGKLRLRESPDESYEFVAMVEAAFRIARAQVLRLLALALTTNDDLERWDTEGGDEGITTQLDVEAKRLTHKASAAELVRLAIAVADLMRDELAGPFGEAREALKAMRPTKETAATPAPEPMRMETEDETSPTGDETSPPTSSTDSPAGTGGIPEPSSTAPPGSSSAVSASA